MQTVCLQKGWGCCFLPCVWCTRKRRFTPLWQRGVAAFLPLPYPLACSFTACGCKTGLFFFFPSSSLCLHPFYMWHFFEGIQTGVMYCTKAVYVIAYNKQFIVVYRSSCCVIKECNNKPRLNLSWSLFLPVETRFSKATSETLWERGANLSN